MQVIQRHALALIIAVTFLISLCILGFFYTKSFQQKKTIQVTGIGSKEIVSDLIVWKCAFTVKSYDLKRASNKIDTDKERVKKYLVAKGVPVDAIQFSSVDISKEFSSRVDENNNRYTDFSGYNLTQEIVVESNQVDKMENIAREITDLINFGIELYSYPPHYFYTNLADLKNELIIEATKNSNYRAEQIANESKRKLGKLQEANVGVFQVVGKHTTDEFTWGGTLNTASKIKIATITVKSSFEIK